MHRITAITAHLSPPNVDASSLHPMVSAQDTAGAHQQRSALMGSTYPFVNWAGVQSCAPSFVHHPCSVEEVQEVIRSIVQLGHRVKVFGSGHSPSDIAMASNTDHMIVLDRMAGLISVDTEACTATVQAGITIAALNQHLDQHGLALSSLGSISDQTIAGAIATGTHGTGAHFGILATCIEWLQLVDGTGRVLTCAHSDDPSGVMLPDGRALSQRDLLHASAVSLGVLGVVTAVRVKCQRAFRLHERQYSSTMTQVLPTVSSLVTASDHTRLWWFPHTDQMLVCLQKRTDKPNTPVDGIVPKLVAAKNKAVGYHLLELLYYGARFTPAVVPAINKAYARLMFGRPQERVARSDQVFNIDCLFKQYVSEWSIPQEKCAQAISALQQFIASAAVKVHFPVEIRFTPRDDIWLSPSYGRSSCWIGIIMYRPYGKDVDYQRYFTGFEQLMRSLGGRPHWAKVFDAAALDLNSLYPKWADFCAVRRVLDPHGTFRNSWSDRVFHANSTTWRPWRTG